MVDLDRQKRKVESGMAKAVHQAGMSSMPHEQPNELWVNALELSEACPFDNTNPQDCPLFLLRKMEPTRRLEWFHSLTENDLGYLAAYHRVCLTIKVGSDLNKSQTETPPKGGSGQEGGRRSRSAGGNAL